MQKILFLTVIVFLLLANVSLADVITLKSGDVLEGNIVDVNSNEVLIKAKMNNDIMICSFEKPQIAEIRLKPYEFPTKITIFDKITLRKGENFLGLVELGMPDAIYFSLLLKQGQGIIRFSREEIVGIDGSYGFRKILAEIYFWWKKFTYKVKRFFLEVLWKKKIHRLTNKNILQILEKLDIEEREKNIDEIMDKLRNEKITPEEADKMMQDVTERRREYNLEDFEKTFRKYLKMEKGKLYKLGIEEKSLMLMMDCDQVKLAWNEPIDIKYEDKKEYWYYLNGNRVVFKDGKLIGYTKRIGSIPKLLRRYYGDIMK